MSSHHNQDTAQQQSSGSHGGGLFSKLKAQATSALAGIPQYNELEHYMRQASVQANPRQSPHTLPGVLAIKGLKGVIIDHDAVARETKNYSKNVLDYARVESHAPGHDVADIQDVGDRLAFLTYKAGELHAEHAKRLEGARIALKDIRNYENTLNAQRERRHALERDIGKLRTSSKPDTATNKKIETLQAELDALIAPGSELSKGEVEATTLKRRMLADSFNKQFDSLQELGEKLAIIAGYGKALVKDWDTSSPNAGKTDYVDGARTAAVRSGVEEALSSWDVRRPRIPLPTINAGSGTNLHHAPSFHESHAGELASLHSVEDPAAAHKEALDSYYNGPPSPAALYQSQYGSQTPSHTGSTPVTIPGAGPTSSSAGNNNDGAAYTTSGASPLVQQLNTAPVTNLPPPTVGGSSVERSPSATSGHSPVPVDTSPMSSSLAPAPSLPTVAETGAPITGTGGPSKGVLGSPDNRSQDTSAAQSKQEEARQELNRRFEEYSGHSSAPSGSGSGTGAGDNYSSELEREISLRARQGHETLPAYSADGSASTDRPAQ